MTFQIEVLRQAVKWAMAEDAEAAAGGASQWQQEYWAYGAREGEVVESPNGTEWAIVRPFDCGTTGCIAAHIVAAAGYRFASAIPVGCACDDCTRNGALTASHAYDPETGRVESIPDLAAEVLGVGVDDEGRAEWGAGATLNALFNGGNNITDVVTVARNLAAAHGEELGI